MGCRPGHLELLRRQARPARAEAVQRRLCLAGRAGFGASRGVDWTRPSRPGWASCTRAGRVPFGPRTRRKTSCGSSSCSYAGIPAASCRFADSPQRRGTVAAVLPDARYRGGAGPGRSVAGGRAHRRGPPSSTITSATAPSPSSKRGRAASRMTMRRSARSRSTCGAAGVAWAAIARRWSGVNILGSPTPACCTRRASTPALLDELALRPAGLRPRPPGQPPAELRLRRVGPAPPRQPGPLPPLRRPADHARRPARSRGVNRPGRAAPCGVRCTRRRRSWPATILMAAGVSGSGPDAHDSATTLATLVPRVARYRDAFYRTLLRRVDASPRRRLRKEQAPTRQPFGGARQHLNAYLARHRARSCSSAPVAAVRRDGLPRGRAGDEAGASRPRRCACSARSMAG